MKQKHSFGTDFISSHLVLCSFFAVLAYTLFFAVSMWQSGEFYFLDTDCYTRYLRITDWLSTDFSWFEKIFPFTNCPNGEVLHFTRINDIIWLFFSLPFMAFMPLKSAIFAGGLIFSPLIFVATSALLLCGLKKFAGETDFQKPALFIFAFALIFLAKTMVFEFGRPDHHSLMLLIATFLSISLIKPTSKNMLFAGIFGACGIWTSSAPEGLLLAYSVLAVLVIGEIFYNQPFDFAYKYTLGLFLGTAFAFAVNPPFEGYLYFDNTRLSLIHVTICALTFLSFAVVKKINPSERFDKIAMLGFCAILSIVILFLIFDSKTIFAPMYTKQMKEYFVFHVAEMQPIIAQECWYFIFGSLEILVLYRLFQRKNFGYMALYILFFIYLPFSVFIRRFMPYGILFYTLINSLIFVELFKRLPVSDYYKWGTLIYITLITAFSVSFSYNITPKWAVYPQLQGCALTDIFFSPQLIYKTGITTVGSPYHRNIEGITDTVEIFSETDEKIIRKRLKKRGVKYIIISDEPLEYLQNAPQNSFYINLMRGTKYDWLKKINEDDSNILYFELTN